MTTQSEALGDWIEAELNGREYKAISISEIMAYAVQTRTLASSRFYEENGEYWLELSFRDGSEITVLEGEEP